MAKGGARVLIGLICELCDKQNYVTEKNKIITVNPLRMKKYCNKCRKHTLHKEKKKLS